MRTRHRRNLRGERQSAYGRRNNEAGVPSTKLRGPKFFDSALVRAMFARRLEVAFTQSQRKYDPKAQALT
jgi:hypothetical protein